jgi:hypothetical protein
MDDAGLVDGLQPLGGADAVVEGLLHGQGALLREDLAEVHALDELHGDVAQAAVLAVLVDPAHVAVPHAPGQADLAPEAPLHLGVGGDLGAQHLDRDGLLELVVAGLVDHPHAALAEGGEDLVAPGHDGPALQGDLGRSQDVAAVEAALGRCLDLGAARGIA